jgi:hypothetical protein
MNCSLSTVAGLISAAIALLVAAIAISYFWVAAVPLFIAAGFVASVSFGLIPAIKNALNAYAQCRGESGKCSISLGINTLGQAAATLSLISFLAAAIMEVAALAFLYSWFLAWLGVSIQVAVAFMVTSGQFSCAITVLILLGVLSNAWAYKNCMDQQGSGSVGGSGTILE